jgi:hypothetical protein
MAKRVSLFSVLRRELGPTLASEGFAEVPQGSSERNSALMYFRDSPSAPSLGFWIQRNVKSSFVDAVGSSFTLELFRSLENPYQMDARERAYFLLTPPEREEMRARQNEMISRLPPLDTILQPFEMKSFAAAIEPERQVISEAFNPLHDIWMRYRDETDVVAWALFIGRILPSLAERFHLAVPLAR